MTYDEITIDVHKLMQVLSEEIYEYMKTNQYPLYDTIRILIGRTLQEFIVRGKLPITPTSFIIHDIKLTFVPTMFGVAILGD
jgi:uncharacterized HAD superfamily protein